jgi:hypothetical protein
MIAFSTCYVQRCYVLLVTRDTLRAAVRDMRPSAHLAHRTSTWHIAWPRCTLHGDVARRTSTSHAARDK